MRSSFVIIIALLLLVLINAFSIGKVSCARASLRMEESNGFLLPSAVGRVMALDYKNLLADFLFFKMYTYYGSKIIRKEKLSREEWGWLYRSADTATDLDPYFLDPYYLGSMSLTWEANMHQEANALLEKAVRYRTWDWTLPFYLGFNYFYFLHDNEKAGEYLMEAAKRPERSGDLVPNLAARLAYKGKQTENSVMFMEEILKKTDDEKIRFVYELRLNALRRILYLEKASNLYKKKYGRFPRDLNQLIIEKFIKEIPNDPYEGEFYIDSDGSIKTTSDLKPQWVK